MRWKRLTASEWDDYKTVWDWRNTMVGQYPELHALYRVVNERECTQFQMQQLKERGLCPGLPDWSLDVARQGYHGLRIEQKKIGGRLTADQKMWLQNHNDNGYMGVVCIGSESVIETISDYCGFKSGLLKNQSGKSLGVF